MRKLTFTVAIGASVWLLACADSTGPVVPHAPAARVGPGFDVSQSDIDILYQAASSPRLWTYKKVTEVCQDQSASIWFRYDDGKMSRRDEVSDFLHLYIPSGALYRKPNGSKFKNGECTQITVVVDPVYLLAEFRPAGLQFDRATPAQLTIWYGGADLDLDGDGDVDAADDAIRRSELDIWRLPHDDDAWEQLDATHDPVQMRLDTKVYRFSHYAVAH